MIKTLLSLTIAIVAISIAKAQSFKEVATLDSKIRETSGIIVSNKNSIWTHNDSGGKNELYNFDSTGKIIRTVYIKNAKNKDWEDLARDTKGNFYIGDFGNNGNSRKDLRIYKTSSPENAADDTLSAEVINFTYEDQLSFPPAAPQQNFDCEAMISFRDSLYIFTKNRTKPATGYTKMYRLPNIPGSYKAVLIDSFYTGQGSSESNWITGADISKDEKKIVLLSNGKIWLFENFKGANFFNGKVTEFTLHFSQKEGIGFINDHEFYITDEVFQYIIGGKLYYFGLNNIITNSPDFNNTETNFIVIKNEEGYKLKFGNIKISRADLKVLDGIGRIIFSETFQVHQGAELDLPKAKINSTNPLILNISLDEGIPQNVRLMRQ